MKDIVVRLRARARATPYLANAAIMDLEAADEIERLCIQIVNWRIANQELAGKLVEAEQKYAAEIERLHRLLAAARYDYERLIAAERETFQKYIDANERAIDAADEIERLWKALEQIAAIENEECGPDWEEIDKARKIANDVLVTVRSDGQSA